MAADIVEERLVRVANDKKSTFFNAWHCLGKVLGGVHMDNSIALLHVVRCIKSVFPYTCAAVWPHRLTARTLGSHPGNRGSIPRGAAIFELSVTEMRAFHFGRLKMLLCSLF